MQKKKKKQNKHDAYIYIYRLKKKKRQYISLIKIITAKELQIVVRLEATLERF